MKDKVSTLIKTLSEKQEALDLFISEQREVSLREAEARLTQLEDRSQILQASQAEIAALHSLSDMDLIGVCSSAILLLFIRCSWCGVFINRSRNSHKLALWV